MIGGPGAQYLECGNDGQWTLYMLCFDEYDHVWTCYYGRAGTGDGDCPGKKDLQRQSYSCSGGMTNCCQPVLHLY